MHLLIIKDIIEVKNFVQIIILEKKDLNKIQDSLKYIYSILRRNINKNSDINELLDSEYYIIEKIEYVRFI